MSKNIEATEAEAPLRLLKVIVQPVMVREVDGFMQEITGETLSVPAADWMEFGQKLLDGVERAEVREG